MQAYKETCNRIHALTRANNTIQWYAKACINACTYISISHQLEIGT